MMAITMSINLEVTAALIQRTRGINYRDNLYYQYAYQYF